ncbi:glycosyltransferase [Amylibacter sp.]|nr:glycosyltransferase [Amylibacter sp.]
MINSEIILSIVTVCFNSESTIQRTFDSVREQMTDGVEYVVIDGASTDTTLNIINKNTDIIRLHISEKDTGMYDAMNKGIKLSNGNFILNLNADDSLKPGAIQSILKILKEHRRTSNTMLFGETELIDSRGISVGNLSLSKDFHELVKKHNPFPHPSAVVSRDLFEKCFGFDTNFLISGDYDFFRRTLQFHPNVITTKQVFSQMRTGGMSSDTGPLNLAIRHQKEIFQIQSHFSKQKALMRFIIRMTKIFIKRAWKRYE